MNFKWCDKCGNPGPFEGKTCLVCHGVVDKFVTDLTEAYTLWLKYYRTHDIMERRR